MTFHLSLSFFFGREDLIFLIAVFVMLARVSKSEEHRTISGAGWKMITQGWLENSQLCTMMGQDFDKNSYFFEKF